MRIPRIPKLPSQKDYREIMKRLIETLFLSTTLSSVAAGHVQHPDLRTAGRRSVAFPAVCPMNEQNLPQRKCEMSDPEISAEKPDPTTYPLEAVLRLLALKWLVHIVCLLGRSESLRFNELQRDLPGKISAKVLSGRLKELEKLAIVAREDKGISPPHVSYHLTPQGRALETFLGAMNHEAQQLPLVDISILS